MKKFLLGIAMLLTAGSSFAQSDFLSADPAEFTIAAGEEKEVTLIINSSSRMKFSAFQARIQMPEGVEPVVLETVEEWSDEIEDFINVPVYLKPMNQMANNNVTITSVFVPAAQAESGMNELRIVEFSMPIVRFPYAETKSEALFSFKVKASDKAQSGEIIKVVQTNVNVAQTGNPMDLEDLAINMDYVVNAKVGESKYATFSWPVAVDFTGSDCKAFIATADALESGFVSREAINKVPANTGVILQSENPNVTFTLHTTKEATDDAKSNILVSTADGPVTVGSADKFFALAKHDKGVGFYRCNKDVVIPQYKAYINSSANADAFLFEETTGISNVEATADNAEVYTISGVKVEKAAQKGIYIVNGKKVVVK